MGDFGDEITADLRIPEKG